MNLDKRRGWAQVRAAVACLTGVLIFALSAAAFVMILFAAVARAWSFFTDDSITEAPVWAWAPGGAGVLAGLATLISFGGAFWYFWRGASKRVLKEVAAVPLERSAFPGFFNVVEALSIGVGRTMPRLYLTDDPVPNVMSLRSSGARSLVLTTGCASLPRDEVEAMCAHEIGHLWADDAHWVTSGMVALARARRFGGLILGLGILLFSLVVGIAHYTDVILWSTGLIAIILVGLGLIARAMLRRLELSVRRHADEIADVVAVKLAKNPQSLGAVCARLAANPSRVTPVGWRSELLWFEAVEVAETVQVGAATGGQGVVSKGSPVARQGQVAPACDADAAAGMNAYAVELQEFNARSNTELLSRARRAYAEARVPLPSGWVP